MGSFNVIDSIKCRWKSNFDVSSSSPNDIEYKIEGFLDDNWNFYNMFSINTCQDKSANLGIPTISKKTDESNVSGYCSRASSSVSDISGNSFSHNSHLNPDKQEAYEISNSQIKSIKIFFSSLSTSVIICETPCRLYSVNDIYELGLREASNRILDWDKLGEGVLFVQFEKYKNTVKSYLCLVNPDNCHLYFKADLKCDSRFHSIRHCVKYLLITAKNGLTHVFGLYFTTESRVEEFINKTHSVLDYISVNNQSYPRRGSNSSCDIQVLPWVIGRKPLNENNSSLLSLLFKGWHKTTQNSKPKISKPTHFEITLHVPPNEYLNQ